MRIGLIAVISFVTVAVVQLEAQSPAATDVWFRQSSKPKDFRAAKLPWNTFTIELPKDWQLVPGFGGILLTAAEKTGSNQAAAAIVLEQARLLEPLRETDIDSVLAGLEMEAARQRDPAGQNFDPQIKGPAGRPFIFLQYARPGLNGQDRVVVYAIPSGRIMYRLTCIAPAGQLTIKYQSIFAHVASSFKPSAEASN